MKRPALMALGIVLVVIGVVWTLQGLGYVGGRVMSGVTLWAVVGPIVAIVGFWLAMRSRRDGDVPR